MGTVVYAYEPNQEVYVIDGCDGRPLIRSGTVIRVRISILAATGSPATDGTILYDIQLDGDIGTSVFDEENVFADKATALIEYDTRIT